MATVQHRATLGAVAMPGATFTSTQLHPDANSGWNTELHPWEAQTEQAPTPAWPHIATPGNTFTQGYPTTPATTKPWAVVSQQGTCRHMITPQSP